LESVESSQLRKYLWKLDAYEARLRFSPSIDRWLIGFILRRLGDIDAQTIRPKNPVHDISPTESLTGDIVVRHRTLIELGCLSDCGFGCFPYILGRDIGPTHPFAQTVFAVCIEIFGDLRIFGELANPFRLSDEHNAVTPAIAFGTGFQLALTELTLNIVPAPSVFSTNDWACVGCFSKNLSSLPSCDK
jgi:hypothetical protein